jgi:hypothetical protein
MEEEQAKELHEAFQGSNWRSCTKCTKFQHVLQFYTNPKTGRSNSWCRSCLNQAGRELHARRRRGEAPLPLLDRTMKVCPDCGRDKDIEEFSKHRTSADGRAAYCKPCRSERNAILIEERRAGVRGYISRQVKVCRSCYPKKELPVSAFSRSTATPDGYQYDCKECVKEQQKVRRADPKKRRQDQASVERVAQERIAGERSYIERPSKVCNSCAPPKEHPMSNFYKDRRKPDGHSVYCKDCDQAKRAARRTRG